MLTELPFLCDSKSLEQLRIAAEGKEIFEHAHVQGFSEPAGTGEEIDFSPVVQKLCDHAGLIHIVESFCADLFKIFNADGQFCRSFQVRSPFLFIVLFQAVPKRMKFPGNFLESCRRNRKPFDPALVLSLTCRGFAVIADSHQQDLSPIFFDCLRIPTVFDLCNGAVRGLVPF